MARLAESAGEGFSDLRVVMPSDLGRASLLVLLKFCSMKISQKIRDEHGDGSTAVASYSDDAVAGMAAKSEEFAAAGNRVYLPLAD